MATLQSSTKVPSLDERVTELEKKVAILENNNPGFFKVEEVEETKKDDVVASNSN